VNIDATKGRKVEYGWPQDLPEGGYYDQVRCPSLELGECLWIAQLFRLDNGNAQPASGDFYGWGMQAAPAPGGTVWLGHNPDDQVLCGKRIEGWNSKIRGAHEDDSWGSGHGLILLPFR
jgi:hypothetical protein